MRRWTPEEREKQSQRIREWQPWKKVGIKSKEVKERNRMNALKHGLYSEETKAIQRYLRQCRRLLEELKGGV